jgi:3-methylcrotonyl-CoA carboxylase alpha subunit
MFSTVLIANRGEIAVRVARGCHALGVRAVAVYSDADSTALHVRSADAAYRIGPPPAAESYLNIDAILAAAQEAGAEAIHPGYGFLSENPIFAERVTAAGITFIGPPASAMRALGDKSAAKRLMIAAGVPVVPGYEDEDQSDARLAAEAERIGYPLLIKASAGGGGRGMREVHAPDQFADALASARREARSSFGDDRVLLEKLVTGARHVEVQVFADTRGNCVYLGERDCSTQRRHQKVIEEAPSPAVDDSLRRRMGEAAVRAAQSAGYVNAGTVEFLLAEDGAFYFLEMNTRLQVEHPVTEAITGLDLVEWQLRVAAGEPLPLRQDQIVLKGHAIEARLYAEDPAHDYLPGTGRLREFRMPHSYAEYPNRFHEGRGERVDAGFVAGDVVSPYYDALLAKIIVAQPDRANSVTWLRTALFNTRVEGLTTNLAQLRAIAYSKEFAQGAVTIDWLERFWKPEMAAPAMPPVDAVLAAAGLLLTGGFPPDRASADAWTAMGPWRVGGAPRQLALALDGMPCLVAARPDGDGNGWIVAWNGAEYVCAFSRLALSGLLIRRGAAVINAQWDANSLRMLPGSRHTLRLLPLPTPDAAASAGEGGAGGGRLTAPMPGLLVKLEVREGDLVRARQTLAVLEAMKMEHAIQADRDGRVAKIYVAAGSRVAGGALLIELEPA